MRCSKRSRTRPTFWSATTACPAWTAASSSRSCKSRPKTAGIAVVLLATRADISEKLAMHDPVEDFVEKPFFLKDATQRIKRVIDKIALEKMAKTAPSDGDPARQPLADERH